MNYYAIKGTTGGGLAYVVQSQITSTPILSPSHHDIWDATLFKNHQDAENALDQLPHGLAKQCSIVTVNVREMAESK